VKKKINTDIKEVIMLIIAENIIALPNVIRTILQSASRSLSVIRGSVFQGNKKKV